MPQRIGFSTGSLARADFRSALHMLQRRQVLAVELSALREAELVPLAEALDGLTLASFRYVSVHAPSRFQTLTEAEVLPRLHAFARRGWPVIVHPDAITEHHGWVELGDCLCVENMDKRKPTGRTVAELAQVFQRLPDASFCLDIGHARQVDPTMTEAALMLRRFGSRLKQLHVSEVNSRSAHEALSFAALSAFRKVAHLVPPHVPLILETPVPEEQIEAQMTLAEEAFTCPRARAM